MADRCTARVGAGPWKGLECHFTSDPIHHPVVPGDPPLMAHRDALFEVTWRSGPNHVVLISAGPSPHDAVLLGNWLGTDTMTLARPRRRP
jgi:hypothetical protein